MGSNSLESKMPTTKVTRAKSTVPWSLLWWALSYPLARWLGQSFEADNFGIAAGIALVFFAVLLMIYKIKR